MIVITGATGNTGKPAAEALLAAGEKIRVVGRSAEKLEPLKKRGAEVMVADVHDVDALTKAFQGADAVYVMLPPNKASDDELGELAKITDVYAKALAQAGVHHAVLLSSIGADVPEKTGQILATRNLEEKLGAVPGLNTLALRPASFMENLFMSIAPLHRMGFLPGPAPADRPAPLIATRDIGEYAARRLKARDFTGHVVQELHGQRDVTMKEVVAAVGAAIGKPGLTYSQIPFMMLEPQLVKSGMSTNQAALLVEMWKSFNDGTIKFREPRNAGNTTPTSIETFAKDTFLPAYLAAASVASA
jgi:uncharacterized protein YbjT (DUF2867 family)